MSAIDSLIARAAFGEHLTSTPERALFCSLNEIAWRGRADQAAYLANSPPRGPGHVPCSTFEALAAAWRIREQHVFGNEQEALARLRAAYRDEQRAALSAARSFLPSRGAALDCESAQISAAMRGIAT
jgi:hypothetical protein